MTEEEEEEEAEKKLRKVGAAEAFNPSRLQFRVLTSKTSKTDSFVEPS